MTLHKNKRLYNAELRLREAALCFALVYRQEMTDRQIDDFRKWGTKLKRAAIQYAKVKKGV